MKIVAKLAKIFEAKNEERIFEVVLDRESTISSKLFHGTVIISSEASIMMH